MYFDVELYDFSEDNEFIARCPELDINGYGLTPEKALFRLEKIIDFYLKNTDTAAEEVKLNVAGSKYPDYYLYKRGNSDLYN